MLRHINVTTRTVLAITTLIGAVAIANAVTSHGRAVSAIEQTSRPSTHGAAQSTANAGTAPIDSLQLAVLLEGFDLHPLLAAAQSTAVSPIASTEEAPT
jgi:hypothetical protein